MPALMPIRPREVRPVELKHLKKPDDKKDWPHSQVHGNREYLAGVIRVGGVDGGCTRTSSSLYLRGPVCKLTRIELNKRTHRVLPSGPLIARQKLSL
jgi:hypothetical protein